MTSRAALLLLGILFSQGLTWAALGAQTATVVVRETPAGPAVPGAIVRLLAGDSVIAQGLTSETGRVTLRAGGAGRFTLQVSRIGYAPSSPSPLDLAAGEARTVELAVLSERILLPELTVQARSSCGKSPAERALAATLWEQVRQALTATRLSERAGLALRSRNVARRLTRGGVIREEQVSQPRVSGSRPFVTLAAAALAERGYVVTDGDSVAYYAPDADLLLSDPFVESHCFGVLAAPRGDSIHIGLSFEPTRMREVADIRGVLWVDRRTIELRRLEFQYAARGNQAQVRTAGGQVVFDRLPGGAWYIKSWTIRMPEIERTVNAGNFQDAVIGFREHGGSAEPLGRQAGAVAPAYFSGRVWDSLAAQGLPGVLVLVEGSTDTAVTDSVGGFEMTLPISGARQATFRHPLLEALDPSRGVRTVELIPAAIRSVQVGTPGIATLVGTICAAGRGKAGLVGILLAGNDAMAGVPITAEWTAAPGSPTTVDRTETTTTGQTGLWAFCDLPLRAAVRLRVGEDSSASGVRAGEIEDGGFRWLPLSIGRTGRAVIASAEAQRLPELKASGSRALEADRRFLEDARARVLRNGAPASALITRADLEKTNSTRMLPLLMSRGLKSRIHPRTGKESLVCAHKMERPAIYLNGLLVDGGDTPGARRMRFGLIGDAFDMESLSPDNVEAVEVYRSMSERPAEYNRTQSECVVVIWTRRGGS
jgi:hypothetical protein